MNRNAESLPFDKRFDLFSAGELLARRGRSELTRPLSARISLDKEEGKGYVASSFRDRLVVESGTARAS